MESSSEQMEEDSGEDKDSAEVLLDLSRQQRNLLLLRPLFQLELSKNKFGDDSGEDGALFDGVDTHYLVLATLDYMMEGTTVALGFTQTEVLGYLAKLVAAMKPSLSLPQCLRIAEVVLDTLDNKARGYQEFAYEYYDAPRKQTRTAKFRLVVHEPDLEDVYRYRPTPEGYLVYLGMLDLSPEDSQELMEKMLQLLVQRGRFEAALEIARRARTLSIEYRQIIRDHLTSALRAPGSVTWTRDLGPRLSAAREHISRRQEEDRRMEDSVRESLSQANEPKNRESLANLLKAVGGASLIRTKLVGDITEAPERFTRAQSAVFRARKPSHLPDLEARIFPDLMRSRVMLLANEADNAITGLYPSLVRRVYELNSVFALLLERRAEELPSDEDVGHITPFSPPEDQFSETVIRETQDWLRERLSTGNSYRVDELLDLARNDALSIVHRRCMALVLIRCFSDSETIFPWLHATADGYFRNDVAQGTNLKFVKQQDAL